MVICVEDGGAVFNDLAVLLYAGIGYVWLQLYRRHKRNDDREGLSRVTRIGWCGITMACIAELSQFMQG